jgi:hypothetical protein
MARKILIAGGFDVGVPLALNTTKSARHRVPLSSTNIKRLAFNLRTTITRQVPLGICPLLSHLPMLLQRLSKRLS